MSGCAMKICGNYKGRLKIINKVSFHRVPNDPVMRKRWTEIIRQSRGEPWWRPLSTSLVCSAHFRCRDLYTRDRRRRLKRDAMPCKALFLSSIQSSDSDGPVHVETEEESTPTEVKEEVSDCKEETEAPEEETEPPSNRREQYSQIRTALDQIQEDIRTLADGDEFEAFGRYVASVLRRMKPRRAAGVQPRIVDLLVAEMIVVDDQEDDRPTTTATTVPSTW